MRSFKKPRIIISVASLLAILTALVGGTVFYTRAQAAGTAAYHPHSVTVRPDPQLAGKPTAALFNCQTDRGPAKIRCYSPQQIYRAYNIDKLQKLGITGKGRTIVIIDAFQNPTVGLDLANFDTTFGLPSSTLNIIHPDGLTPFDPNDPNQVGWAEEITLDVQWSHAIAPSATIDLVLAKSNQDADLLSATQYAINHNLGDVISQSFGEAETCVDPALLKAEHAAFANATRKNITILASSGDQGAAQPTCDGNSWFQSASSPASDPLVTGVGATELHAAPDVLTGTANPPAGTYQSEVALNQTNAPVNLGLGGNFSTGGGFSTLYKRPEFQEGVPNIQGNHRGVPDVAYTGGINFGVLAACDVCAPGAGAFAVFGGTSVGSPNWAGLVALGDQLVGRRLGFINSSLYRIGKVPYLYNASFHDITQGNNAVTEPGATGPVAVPGFNALPNWDATTGLGTPKADVLIPTLAALNFLSDGDAAISHS